MCSFDHRASGALERGGAHRGSPTRARPASTSYLTDSLETLYMHESWLSVGPLCSTHGYSRHLGRRDWLLDTLYAMRQRQAWLHEALVEDGSEALPFVGRAALTDEP